MLGNFSYCNPTKLYFGEKALKSLEDEYDARVADMRLEEYENYLDSGGKVLEWEEL